MMKPVTESGSTSTPSRLGPVHLIRQIAVYLALILGSVVMVFPFAWMLLSSFKTPRDIRSYTFWPTTWTLDNYRNVLFDTDFLQWFLNSFVVASLTTLCVLFFCALTGYVLAKLRFVGKAFVFLLILSTLMIPTEMLVIPWYVMAAQWGWMNTYWGLAFPGLMSGFGVFLMRQFFYTVPNDIFAAARIDGASEWGLFWRIGLPLVRPALAALGIFSFIGNWNAFLWPLIVAKEPAMRTIPVGIATFAGEASTAWHLIMAASALAIVPVLIVFAIFQRQIIEGIVLTGTKG